MPFRRDAFPRFILASLILQFFINAALAQPPLNERLALRHAPIHYQDVDQTGGRALHGRSDYITAINFDNDWDVTNNWANIAKADYQPTAHCYYSVVASKTHWYIVYAFFHPRDWADDPLADLFGAGEHQNDLEGLLAIIARPVKEGDPELGTLEGIVTVAHSDFYSYVPKGSPLKSGGETVDGELKLRDYQGQLHPITCQQAKGHGLKAWPHYQIEGDGVIYYPTLDNAAAPTGPDDRDVKYKLVDIFAKDGLWSRRNDSKVSGGFGSFAGGGANFPWGWDDHDDGPVMRGEFATDPAKLAAVYFKGFARFDAGYTSNPYREVADPAQRKLIAQVRVRNKPLAGQNWRASDNMPEALIAKRPNGGMLEWELEGAGRPDARFDVAIDVPHGGDDTVLKSLGTGSLTAPVGKAGRGYYIGNVQDATNEWMTVRVYWRP